MSTDIHTNLEKRTTDGIWQNIDSDARMTIFNNYGLFGLLASVREDYKESLVPRGLPYDLSQKTNTARKAWGIDGHTESFQTLAELIDLRKSLPDKPINPYYHDLLAAKDPSQVEAAVSVTTPSGLSNDAYDGLDDLIANITDYLTIIGLPLNQVVNPNDIRIVYWFDN